MIVDLIKILKEIFPILKELAKGNSIVTKFIRKNIGFVLLFLVVIVQTWFVFFGFKQAITHSNQTYYYWVENTKLRETYKGIDPKEYWVIKEDYIKLLTESKTKGKECPPVSKEIKAMGPPRRETPPIPIPKKPPVGPALIPSEKQRDIRDKLKDLTVTD